MAEQQNSFGRDFTQRLVPFGATGRSTEHRSLTDRIGALLGGLFVPVAGSALGGEAGERFGNTRLGQWINNLGGDGQGAYTGSQLNPMTNNAIWNINPLIANGINYQGFGSGTGAYPYNGTPASQSGEEMYNSAIAGSQGYTDNRNHTNTPNGMPGITSPVMPHTPARQPGSIGAQGINNTSSAMALGQLLTMNAGAGLGSRGGWAPRAEPGGIRQERDFNRGGDGSYYNKPAPHALAQGTSLTAQDWIKNNPALWAVMQQQMTGGAGR